MVAKLNPAEFLRLKKGENRMRFISSPYMYQAHRINNQIEKCTQFGGKCKHCDDYGRPDPRDDEFAHIYGKKVQNRWVAGVIDRATGDAKVLDFPVQIFINIQKLSRHEDWGDPRKYDMIIMIDEMGGETGLYTVMPKPKTDMSAGDIDLGSEFNLQYMQAMVDYCDPTKTQPANNPWHILASNKPVISYGTTCSSCSKYYPYAQDTPGFKCWSCTNGY